MYSIRKQQLLPGRFPPGWGQLVAGFQGYITMLKKRLITRQAGRRNGPAFSLGLLAAQSAREQACHCPTNHKGLHLPNANHVTGTYTTKLS